MTNLTSSTSLRTAAFAVAAAATMTLATAPAAQAHHFNGLRGLGLSIEIGGGGSRLYVGHSCRWLYRNAVSTGSPYWWDRYEACRYGY